MGVLIFLCVYAILCASIHSIAYNLHHYGGVTSYGYPNSRVVYYILSFTWGLPMNIFGIVFALVMLCIGKRPKKHGWNYYFEFNIDWGLELGIFFIAPKDASDHLKNHELGHSIQNIYYGIFTIGVITIPSAVRFWVRNIQGKRGKILPPYDCVWFEGSATASGEKFMAEFNK